MTDSDRIKVSYRDKELEIPYGSTVLDLMKANPHPEDPQVLGAIVKNRVEDLDFPLRGPGLVVPVTYSHREGALIYRKSACLILYEVFYTLFPKCHIAVGQSLSEGYYFEVSGVGVNDHLLAMLKRGMDELVAEGRPYRRWVVSADEAEELFRVTGRMGKYELIRTLPTSHMHLVSLGNFIDIKFGPVAPDTSKIRGFDLVPCFPDFVLRFPEPASLSAPRITGAQPSLYKAYKESKQWSRLLGVEHVGQLNRLCIDGGISDLIKIAEGLHEKKIASIADQVAEDTRRGRRLVLISGPSSAGKTTFTKRLSIQLRVNGLEPVSISMDNYYLNREDSPKRPEGGYDFEALEAIDLKLLNEHLQKILRGEEVRTPRFDFAKGRRVETENWSSMHLGPSQIILIEGIHGLNPSLTMSIPIKDKFRIYVNALTQLSVDHHNRILTSDTRLIRRIVRDRLYRGYRASDTIAAWPGVRLGERRYIFPYQEEADVIFNSSLIYEPAVMHVFAQRFLLEVPRISPEYSEAYRLMKFLGLFVPVLLDEVPQTSILREFVGGSSFRY